MTEEPPPQTPDVTGEASVTVANQEQSTSVLLVYRVQMSTEAATSAGNQDPVATDVAEHIVNITNGPQYH